MYVQCQKYDTKNVSNLSEMLKPVQCSFIECWYDECGGKAVVLIGLSASAESTLALAAYPCHCHEISANSSSPSQSLECILLLAIT